jgi:hypothetical protein
MRKSRIPGNRISAPKLAQFRRKSVIRHRHHGLGVSLYLYAVSDLEQKIDAVTMLESDVFTDSELI